jgi:hypothetical protein
MSIAPKTPAPETTYVLALHMTSGVVVRMDLIVKDSPPLQVARSTARTFLEKLREAGGAWFKTSRSHALATFIEPSAITHMEIEAFVDPSETEPP